jgi:hypothetical protein
VPLPGTPDEHGRQHERPRGAGTGYLWLERFDSGGVAGVRARITHPRSSSVAARHWNLICHLQAHGVVAPQLVAVGERGASPFGAQSFLITRELAGFVPLARFLADERDSSLRRRALHSLALAGAQVLRCGAWLPCTTLDGVMVQTHDDQCAALQVVDLRSEQHELRARGLVRGRLPAIAFTQFVGGSLRATIAARRQSEWWSKLGREAKPLTSQRERALVALRVFRRAEDALRGSCG